MTSIDQVVIFLLTFCMYIGLVIGTMLFFLCAIAAIEWTKGRIQHYRTMVRSK